MDHFALQGSMALPYSVFLIAYLALFGREDSLYTYVILVCVAWLLQFAMCLPYMFKEHYLYRPVLDIKQGYIKVFIKTSIVTIITSSMYLFCYLIDSSRASMLGEGTTSAFYYADKIFTPLTTTFIYSISAVMFPKFNREYAKSGEREYKGYVWSITSGTLIAVFPVCALLIVFGEPIIKVLFESGNFTSQSTAATAEIFVMYALGMAGFSIIDLLNKAFYTMNKSLVPLIISLGIIAMNFVTDIIFNISGALLALSTSVSMTVGAVVTIVIMFRGSKIVNLAPAVKSLAASCAIGVVAYELKNLFVFSTDGKIMLVLKCGVIGVVSLALFMVLCLLLKIEPVSDIIKGKLKKS
jgi:putative peptidoglycan lipid II flippase